MTTYDPTTDESIDDLMTVGKFADAKSNFVEIAVVDVWDCVLAKGVGKVPFDPTQHAPERRCVAISMTLIGTRRDGSTYDMKQDDISSGIKFSETLPSLKALGVSGRAALAALAGSYAQVERVDTRETYAARKASADGKIQVGDPVKVQSFKFLALFPDAEACKAAELAFYAPRGRQAPGDGRNVPQAIEPDASAAARATLIKSLPMLWQALAGNVPVFVAMIESPRAQYRAAGITRWSDEVVALTGEIPF